MKKEEGRKGEEMKHRFPGEARGGVRALRGRMGTARREMLRGGRFGGRLVVLGCCLLALAGARLLGQFNDPTADQVIAKLVEKTKVANRKCNKPNSQLKGDYLLNVQKKEKDFKSFPSAALQHRAECNAIMLTELANEFKDFVEMICPVKKNGLPNTAKQIEVPLKTPNGIKYLRHITLRARKLQRLSLKPLKLLEDLYHPPELQAVASILMDNVAKAEDFVQDMIRVAV